MSDATDKAKPRFEGMGDQFEITADAMTIRVKVTTTANARIDVRIESVATGLLKTHPGQVADPVNGEFVQSYTEYDALGGDFILDEHIVKVTVYTAAAGTRTYTCKVWLG